MNFLGALGGIGRGVTAGIKDWRDADAEKQKQDENAMRMKVIQQGMDIAAKGQERKDKEWTKEDAMQAEIDAINSRYLKSNDVGDQRSQFNINQSAGRVASSALNPAANGVGVLPQTQVEPATFAGSVAARAAQNGVALPVSNRVAPSLDKIAPQSGEEFKPKGGSYIDKLNHMTDLLEVKNRYGKAGEGDVIQVYHALNTLKKEGVHDAVAKAKQGDFAGALQVFNDVGEYRGAKLVGQPVKSVYEFAGQKIPTVIMEVVMPDGTQHTINTAEHDAATAKATDVWKMGMDSQKAARDSAESKAKIGSENAAAALHSAQAENEKNGIGRSDSSTAEIKNVNFLVKNGIAKDAKEGWEMVRTGKTPAGFDIKPDGMGGLFIIDPNTGAVSKNDGSGEETVIRKPKNDTAAPKITQAPPAAIAYLKEHPEANDAFKAKYGYLPGGM